MARLHDLATRLVDVARAGSFTVCAFPAARKAIDIGDYYSDFSLIRNELGWQPKVPLRDELRETVEFFRAFLRHYL